MTGSTKACILPILALFLLAAAPAGATVESQCPTLPGGAVLGDLNGDGFIRADQAEITLPVSPTQVCLHLTAGDGFVNMADKSAALPNGTSMYIFSFSNVTGVPDAQVMAAGMLAAEFSAPTLKFKEGDNVYLSLTNVGMTIRPDLFDPHSVHWHGFTNAAPIFDGEPMASATISMGSTFTYYYNVVEPGTYMWHCHVEAPEHMQLGMLGNLYVTPAQDGTTLGGFNAFAYNDGDGSTGYSPGRQYPIQIVSFDPKFHEADETIQPLPFAAMNDKFPMLNGRGYPDTINPNTLVNDLGNPSQKVNAIITATQGETILLRVSSLSTTSFHTLTTLGLPMQVVGTGARILRGGGLTTGTPLYYNTNSVTLGGGESVDVLINTENVSPGTYFLYTTNLNHLSNNKQDYGGMMTEIVVN